ncbi:hypothetical protein ACIQMZ_05870 [Streptomyces longwoodensis]|uniref:hypothetical protein n=1 Tax=Streptomyces longwoodensis TaxID=68231 RepID=UPI003808F9B3
MPQRARRRPARGQRAAAGECGLGAALLGGDAAGGEQHTGPPVGVERPYGQRGERVRPAEVQRPFGVGGDPAGQDDERVVGELRQERLAQPRLQGPALLERVDEQQRSGFGARRGRGLLQPARIAVEEPAVHVHHASAGQFVLPRGVAQQRGLADAAGPCS